MNTNVTPPGSSVIRITKDEATSEHVDNLLKRQMSLRGDPGVTRASGKKWYFQNWLVLALAGALGALVAWGVIEPYFDDLLYIQGPITNLDLTTATYSRGHDVDSPGIDVVGTFKVNGQRVLILEQVREIVNGQIERLDVSTLHEGDPVGVHLEYITSAKEDIAFVRFVDRSDNVKSGPSSESLSHLQARSRAAGMLMFSVVSAMIGLFVGAVDGLVCRLPRRALISGAVGLFVGFVGGFIFHLLANLVYAPLSALAMRQMSDQGVLSTFGFLVQMVGRSMAWALVGVSMGLGQGLALRSGRLLVYGLIGGLLGGLFGGVLFDPIDLVLVGAQKPSAHLSRLIGFVAIGLTVGGMIGLVELLARDAWLRMTQGPLTGKEFLIFKTTMSVASSPQSDLYLFNDPQVAKHHATIRAVGDDVEIEARDTTYPLLLNNRSVSHARLRHGDNVTLGRTSFVFQRRKG